MEIDLTPEVAGQPPTPSLLTAPRRYRRTMAVALTAGLVTGGGLGVSYGRTTHAPDGRVVLTHARLATVQHTVVLRWGLANFGAAPARVQSVLVDGTPAAVEAPDVAAATITDFTTPVRCNETMPPQLAVTVELDGDETTELGYLPDAAEWATACQAPALPAPANVHVLTQLTSQTGFWKGTVAVGQAHDTGPVTIGVVCVGDGKIELSYDSDAGEGGGGLPCDGKAVRTEGGPAGPFLTVRVTPDGRQRWSLLLTRQ